MKIFHLLLISVQLGGATACAGQTVSPRALEQANSWRSTTYVYGALAFDTVLGREQMGPVPYVQQECSTSAFHCVAGNIFTIATPVDCADFSEGRFGPSEAETFVLRRETGGPAFAKMIPESYATPIWLLGSTERPHVVFVYAAVGVIGVYRDLSSDLVTLARDQGLTGLDTVLSHPGAAYLPLISFKPWGGCQGRIEPAARQYSGPASPIG